jgi:hypothetical protein
MAHRAKKGRLHRIGPPERLGVERLGGQPLAVDGDPEQRRERRDQPPPRGRPARGGIVEVDDAHPPFAGDERVGALVAGRSLAELDPRPVGLKDASHLGGDPLQLAAHVAVGQERRGDPGQELRLGGAAP